MKNIRKNISSLVRNRTLLALVPAVVIAVGASGCISPGTGSTSFLNTAGNTTTIPGGPKAAQIIFTNQASADTGSFNPAALGGNGTKPGAGLGLQATQLFNPDGTPLTTTGGTSDPNWPAWLTSVEIGISGSPNNVAPNTKCANFGTGTSTCTIGGTAGTTCDVANTYAISEYDCDTGTGGNWGSGNATGNGTQSDGVYIRANFNRANLGSLENIMVVVNYAATAFNQANPTPSSCFSMGSSVPFSPETCADFTWRAFETYGPTYSFVQPFLMLVPPMYSYTNNTTSGVSGTTAATKQFILPFAGDANLSTFVIGRTGSILSAGGTTNFQSYCGGTGVPNNDVSGSPLCAGIVFYSMTFFRI